MCETYSKELSPESQERLARLKKKFEGLPDDIQDGVLALLILRMMAAKPGTKQVPVPDPLAALFRPKSETVAMQTLEIKQTNRVTCYGGCGRKKRVHSAFKCLYCGEWYCAECAEGHFGLTRKEYDAGKRSHHA